MVESRKFIFYTNAMTNYTTSFEVVLIHFSILRIFSHQNILIQMQFLIVFPTHKLNPKLLKQILKNQYLNFLNFPQLYWMGLKLNIFSFEKLKQNSQKEEIHYIFYKFLKQTI